MAFSLNKVSLIGNLAKDSESRCTTDGLSITNFCVVTEENYKNKSGEWIKNPTFHNVTAFNLSDFYKGALKKGKKIYVEGRLQKKEYEDKDGIKRYAVNVIVEKLIPLSSVERDGETTPTVGQSYEGVEDDSDVFPF